MPDEDEVVRTLRENLQPIHEAALLCLAHDLPIPAVILAYSGIDIFAGLHRPEEGQRDRFVEWTEEYVLPEETVGCSADDLYGARCGVVHEFSSYSDRWRKGEVSRLVYVSQLLSVEDGQEVIDQETADGGLDRPPPKAVSAESVVEGFRRGAARYLSDLRGMPEERREEIAEEAGKIFETASEEWVEERLAQDPDARPEGPPPPRPPE